MTWDEMLAAHAQCVGSTQHGAEEVTWTPLAGTPRTFSAQVVRLGQVSGTGPGRSITLRAVLELPVHPTAGVPDGLTPTDTFDVVLTRGSPAVPCRIVQVLSHDAGSIKVEVEG